MEMVVLMLGSGALLGFVLRNKRRVSWATERLTTWTVWLLLFMMGISVGSNHTLLSNLLNIGINAIVISVASIAGSIAAGWVLYRYLFQKSDTPKNTNHPPTSREA